MKTRFTKVMNSNTFSLQIWTSKSAGGALTSDLPTFSLSPQEYITKVWYIIMYSKGLSVYLVFMRNESECRTNKSHEPQSDSLAIGLFWQMTNIWKCQFSYVKLADFSIHVDPIKINWVRNSNTCISKKCSIYIAIYCNCYRNAFKLWKWQWIVKQ